MMVDVGRIVDCCLQNLGNGADGGGGGESGWWCIGDECECGGAECGWW